MPSDRSTRSDAGESVVVCHWCGEPIDGTPVLWDIQERDKREWYHRYRYCSNECKEEDKYAGRDAVRHTEPELHSREEIEVHR